MKNHFFIPYSGNKRQEVKQIYDNTELKPNIKYIVEPYAGTSALSYYIWLNNKNKNYKYVLNDNNNYLIELYNIAKDESKLKKLYENLQKIYNSVFSLKTEDKKKEAYDKIDMLLNLENWLFKNKIYNIKINMFPMLIDGKRRSSLKTLDSFINAPIIDFIRNADIIFTNKNAIDVYKEYKNNEEAFIFLDPPYLTSCNSFYKNPDLQIYEYLFDNPINNNEAYIILCLENNWIIKLLFKNYHSVTYSKKYETSHRNTEHIIILNKISSINI